MAIAVGRHVSALKTNYDDSGICNLHNQGVIVNWLTDTLIISKEMYVA